MSDNPQPAAPLEPTAPAAPATSGGYVQPEYWDEEGNGWREFARAAHPTFWRRSADG